MLLSRPIKLLVVLVGVFIMSILVSEVIGIKLFSLEDALRIPKNNFSLLGESGLSFTLSVGVLPWPIIFILTDVINDYFGYKVVRFISYLNALLLTLAFLLFYGSIVLPPDTDWWINSTRSYGVDNMQTAYKSILGQSMNIIIGSITAFLIGQLIDAFIFRKIKKHFGNKYMWLRATASTLVSQFMDSFIVIFIAFYLLKDMSFARVLALCFVSYGYKFVMALLTSPMIYVINFIVKLYLGKDEALRLQSQAI